MLCQYCSSSFEATGNNHKYCSPDCKTKAFWKRHRKHCPSCGKFILHISTFCNNCSRATVLNSSTLGEAIEICGSRKKAFTKIRSRARASVDALTSCINCGYSKHVEVCHRIAIAEFSDNALVSEINNTSNLLILCRNCHWEYDHELLKL